MGGDHLVAAAGDVEKTNGGKVRRTIFFGHDDAHGRSGFFKPGADTGGCLVGAFARGLHQILDHLPGDAISQIRKRFGGVGPGKEADKPGTEVAGDGKRGRQHFVFLRPAGHRHKNFTDGHITLHL